MDLPRQGMSVGEAQGQCFWGGAGFGAVGFRRHRDHHGLAKAMDVT
jgi:hypothetical protein